MKLKIERRFHSGYPFENIQKLLIAIIFISFFLFQPVFAIPPRLHVEGNQVKDPNGNNVILRGIALIDLGTVEAWKGGAINAIDRITDPNDNQGNSKGWYTKIIRIMIAPPDTMDPCGSWPHSFHSDSNDLYDLLRTVVDYCGQKEVYVAIDWHYCANTYDHVAKTSEFWQYIAPKFADDTHVIYELFNEPVNQVGSDEARWTSVKNDMETWIDIIRGSAPHNLLFIGTPSYCQNIGPTETDPVDDVNVVYMAHIYPLHWLSSSNQYYRDTITAAAAVHPVIMGEWGFTTDTYYDDQWHVVIGNQTNYGQPIKEFIEGLRIGNIAWCSGGWDWGPPMFYSNNILRVGEGEMGGFAKDWLYQTSGVQQDVNLTIKKCSLAAGKVAVNGIQANKDSIQLSGTFASSPIGLDEIEQIDINIVSMADGNIIYQQSCEFSSHYNSATKKFLYNHGVVTGQPGAITNLTMDFNKKTFLLKAKNIDLTGLGANVRLDIGFGNYALSGEANETIINGKSRTAIIPTRLMRTYKDTLIVTKAKASNRTKDGGDSLSLTGDIAVEYMDFDTNEPNLVTKDVNIIWGSRTFVIPHGRFKAYKPGRTFKCSKAVADANVGAAGKVTASIDLDKCKYTIAVKDVNLADTNGVVNFSVNFADFDEAVDVNVTKGY